jgi:hypothetical protein
MEVLQQILLPGVLSIIVAVVTAYLTTRQQMGLERLKSTLDIEARQRFNYFLPFKYAADEFLRRLKHIETRLSAGESHPDKYKEMVSRFSIDIQGRTHKWFYDGRLNPPGGYFATSTMYMNCLLFYWMKRIQWEYPYIPLKLEKSTLKARSREDRFVDADECNVYDFIKEIKVRISGYMGIPYGIHDSLGDALFEKDGERVMNYDDFSMKLMDIQERVKFSPLIEFWTGLILPGGEICAERLEKIRELIQVLELLQSASVRDSH